MRRVHLAMLALVTVWGFNFALVKSTFDELPPLVFNGLRFALASVLLLLAMQRIEPQEPSSRPNWRRLFVLGLIGNSAYQLFFILGLARTTAGNSSIILATTPIFIALLGVALGIERLTRRTWAGITLAFAGILLLVGGKGEISLSSRTIAGDILIILCTICWSVYTVFSRPLLKELSPLRLTAVTMALGTPALILAAVPQMIRLNWTEVSWQSWAALFFSASLAVALGYVVWYTSVQIVGNTRTAVYSNLIPVVALISAWLLLGETISAVQGIGAAVALAGVSLARSASL
ncbi:MAG TPA: DMT family transporter, partial [bacterium]|nr:DMT family transporter [bacterium]